MVQKTELSFDLTGDSAAASLSDLEKQRRHEGATDPEKGVKGQDATIQRGQARRVTAKPWIKTIRRREASRRNGSRSKGPKTHAGKKVSSHNALKHGLTSRNVLLPDEDDESFAQFRGRLWADYNPVGARESLKVEKIIGYEWRLQRVRKYEAAILCYQRCCVQAEQARARMERFENPGEGLYESMASERELLEEQGAPEDEIAPYRNEEYDRARAELRRYQAELESDLSVWGGAVIRDSGSENALLKMSRYETSLERNIAKLEHELDRLQSARKGQQVPPPIAVDINISGLEPEGVEPLTLLNGKDRRSVADIDDTPLASHRQRFKTNGIQTQE